MIGHKNNFFTDEVRFIQICILVKVKISDIFAFRVPESKDLYLAELLITKTSTDFQREYLILLTVPHFNLHTHSINFDGSIHIIQFFANNTKFTMLPIAYKQFPAVKSFLQWDL